MPAEDPKRKLLGDLLQAAAENEGADPESPEARELLRNYAELQFRLHGGAHCAGCNAHVRHVVPVLCRREDGSEVQYPCLCTRCLEAEKAQSVSVVMALGKLRVDWKRKVRKAAQ